ncbi:unnamed protein product [Polarella glacialis]|uniref:Uncharacterized protein n=1 Tax=Polarella glacialis TaxID=89957 RepID=A0A813E615_POLGL|nr:unnamed protein product [Polarella glacialis]
MDLGCVTGRADVCLSATVPVPAGGWVGLQCKFVVCCFCFVCKVAGGSLGRSLGGPHVFRTQREEHVVASASAKSQVGRGWVAGGSWGKSRIGCRQDERKKK